MSIMTLQRPGKPDIAWRGLDAAGDGARLPCLIFCGGFRSDMEGTKAQFLEQECRARGQAFVRFDYSGHGASAGAFEDGTIGAWTEDALAVLDGPAGGGPVVIAGSSMGGWIALLAALARPDRVAGLIGIAAAPDFTRLIREQMDESMRARMNDRGFFNLPGAYDPEPCPITKTLLDEAEAHCLLDRTIPLDIPIRLLQGMKDPDVPWQTAYRIKNALSRPGCAEVVLVETGDHRLSRPEDLRLLGDTVRDISAIAAV